MRIIDQHETLSRAIFYANFRIGEIINGILPKTTTKQKRICFIYGNYLNHISNLQDLLKPVKTGIPDFFYSIINPKILYHYDTQ